VVSNLPLLSFLILFSAGCGLLTTAREVDKQAPEETPPTQVVEKLPVESKSPSPTQPVKSDSDEGVGKGPKPESKSLTQGEVRRLQAKLKASGFDPGPIDGILGPKTRSAFLQLQSSCLALLSAADLTKEGDVGFKPVADITVLSEPTLRTSSKEHIQRIQAHLKQSGFDPGPVDGIFGHKTNAAMLRAREGCSLAKETAIMATDYSIGGDQTTPPVIPAPQISMADSDSPPSTEFVGRGSNKLSLAADEFTGVDEIRSVQSQLKEAGFDPGPVDGILGPRTRSALLRYQASNGFRNALVRSSAVGVRKEY